MEGHNGDVAALSLKPRDSNIFVTGSVDRTARLWDLRRPGSPGQPGSRTCADQVVQDSQALGPAPTR